MHHLGCDQQLIVMVASNIGCQLACHSPGSLPGKEKKRTSSSRNVRVRQPTDITGRLRRAEAVSSFCCCPHVLLRALCCSELSLLCPAPAGGGSGAPPSGLVPLLYRWVAIERVAHSRSPNCCYLPQSGGGGRKEAEFKPLDVGTNSNNQAAERCRSTLHSPTCHLSNCLSSDFHLEKGGVRGWFKIWY